MPHSKDDPKDPEWRPYIFAREQWNCRICGDRFQSSETVRNHIADAHDENMPPSMYEYFRGAVWRRKKIPRWVAPRHPPALFAAALRAATQPDETPMATMDFCCRA